MPWVGFFFLLGTSPIHQVLHDFLPPAPGSPETQPLSLCQAPKLPRRLLGSRQLEAGREPCPVLSSICGCGDEVETEPGAQARPRCLGSCGRAGMERVRAGFLQ